MAQFKRIFASILGAALIAGSMAACGGSTGGSTGGGTAADNTAAPEASAQTEAPAGNAEASTIAIRHINGKIEIDSQLKAYAEAYKEKTGQEVIIESLGGGVDIDAQIKNYNAAGNMPDLFPTGYGSLAIFKDFFYDLSNEPWVGDTDLSLFNAEGTLVGAPFTVEGLGLLYNKDMLDKAGISVDSLNSLAGQKAAFEKLEGMKDELGIQAVIAAAAEPSQMFWVTGNHVLSAYYSLGLAYDDHKYADMMLKGEVDKDRLGKFADYLQVLFQYADPQVLASGTYEDQTALWLTQKSVFIAGQGNWLDPEMPKYDATFECGIAPLAFLEQETPGVTVSPPSYWAVYKDSKNLDGALAYLNEILTSEDGQKALVNEAGCISAFKSATISPSGKLSVDITERMKGASYNWDWTKQPSGMCQTAIAPVIDLFAKGQIDRDTFVDMTAQAIADFIAANPQ